MIISTVSTLVTLSEHHEHPNRTAGVGSPSFHKTQSCFALKSSQSHLDTTPKEIYIRMEDLKMLGTRFPKIHVVN